MTIKSIRRAPIGVRFTALVTSLLVVLGTAAAAEADADIVPQTVRTGVERVFAADNEKIGIDGVDDKRIDVDVAVVDAGVNLDHPDLNVVEGADCSEATAPTYTCSSEPGDGDDPEIRGHGTQTAEIIASIDNGIGFDYFGSHGVGVAPGARIWAISGGTAAEDATYFAKAQEQWEAEEPIDPIYSYVEEATAALKWVTARADQIEVLHLSMHCSTEPPVAPPWSSTCVDEGQVAVLEEAIEEAIEAGVVVVVPAGNLNEEIFGPAAPLFPVRIPDLIAVGAIFDSDGLPGGEGPSGGGCHPSFPEAEEDDTEVDGSAHGAGIDLTAPGPCTSFSSPFASAAAAILASRDNPENAEDVKAIRDAIVEAGNTKSAAEGGWDDESGDGFKEPLIDVSDEELFDPKMLPGCDVPAAPEVESDVDGDGHSDLVTLHPDGSLTVHGGGEGETGLQFASGVDSRDEQESLTPALFIGEGDHAVDVADVTADGCADLVALTSDGDAVVYPGRPDATFGFPIPSLEGTLEPALLKPGGEEPIAAADVDGDGHADLVSYDDESDYVTVYPGTAAGTFDAGESTEDTVTSALHTGSGEYFLDAGDVTGDGRSDLVSMTTWDDIWVRPGESDGSFGGPIGSSYTAGEVDTALDDGEGREPVGLGDVTGDGRADLATVEGGKAYVYPAQSGGNLGRFGEPETSFPGETPSTTFGASPGSEIAGVLDVDGDGSADMVVAYTNGHVYVAKGEEDGSFSTIEASFEEGFLKSTQHFQNQDAEGSELVIEKPAMRRRGCASDGCHHTTASPSLVSGFGAAGRSGSGGYSIYPGEPDGDVRQRWWTAETGWSGWGWHASPPGGQATSESAAASPTATSDYVFVRGANGALWEKHWTDESGKWSEWASLGGELATGPGPAAVSRESGKMDVFARAAAGKSVIRKSWSSGSGWGSWETVSGTEGTTGLGALGASGGIDLYMRDSNGDVTQRWWTPSTGWSEQGWHGSPPGGATTSAPAAVLSSPGNVHVFVRGADRAIWEKTWNGEKWSDWTSLGGVLRSGPSVASAAAGEIHLFARAANDSYWRKRWSAEEGWSGWEGVV